jgi:hypothetical protein
VEVPPGNANAADSGIDRGLVVFVDGEEILVAPPPDSTTDREAPWMPYLLGTAEATREYLQQQRTDEKIREILNLVENLLGASQAMPPSLPVAAETVQADAVCRALDAAWNVPNPLGGASAPRATDAAPQVLEVAPAPANAGPNRAEAAPNEGHKLRGLAFSVILAFGFCLQQIAGAGRRRDPESRTENDEA